MCRGCTTCTLPHENHVQTTFRFRENYIATAHLNIYIFLRCDGVFHLFKMQRRLRIVKHTNDAALKKIQYSQSLLARKDLHHCISMCLVLVLTVFQDLNSFELQLYPL